MAEAPKTLRGVHLIGNARVPGIRALLHLREEVTPPVTVSNPATQIAETDFFTVEAGQLVLISAMVQVFRTPAVLPGHMSFFVDQDNTVGIIENYQGTIFCGCEFPNQPINTPRSACMSAICTVNTPGIMQLFLFAQSETGDSRCDGAQIDVLVLG